MDSNSSSPSSSDNNEGHVVLLPFMAQGHLIPFLALARKFQERKRFAVTIATTPLNLQYIRSAAAGGSPEIHLAELSFRSADHGLPPDTENTENLPTNLIVTLLQASNSLKAPVERLVEEIAAREGRPPACLVFDVFLGWAVDIGNKFGIKNIAFSTGGAYGTLAYNSMWLHLPHLSTEADEFEVPGFPKHIRFQRSQLHRFIRDTDRNDQWCKFFQAQISASSTADAWICNTVQELEPLGLQLLHNYLKVPVWPVGPLLPSSFLCRKSPSSSSPEATRVGKKAGISVEECNEWLSYHSPDSVLYISFGSQNTIGASQMMALAKGLEAARKPFLWVIRPPLGFDIKGDFRSDEWLPEGFEQRVTETKQGLLVKTWAPQLEILSHSSTRAFLSHCGWNSVMESLSQGVPIIGWPIAAEQAYNAKMMVEEMGVCVELTRGPDKEIHWEHVKKVVEIVMDNGGEGDEMKRKAVEFGEKIRASVRDHQDYNKGDGVLRGSSLVAMDQLQKFILSN